MPKITQILLGVLIGLIIAYGILSVMKGAETSSGPVRPAQAGPEDAEVEVIKTNLRMHFAYQQARIEQLEAALKAYSQPNH